MKPGPFLLPFVATLFLTHILDTTCVSASDVNVEADPTAEPSMFDAVPPVDSDLPMTADPASDPADNPIAALILQADDLLASSDLQGALALYDQALTLSPDDVPALYKRAVTRLALGRPALDDLDRVLDLEPSFSKAYLQRARIHIRHANWPKALADADAYDQHADPASAGGPDVAALRDEVATASKAATQGHLYAQEEKWDKAAEAFATAVRAASDSAPLREAKARAFLALGDVDAAVADYSRAAVIDPTTISHQFHAASLSMYAQYSPRLALARVKQCLHSDPEQKDCKALFRRIKKTDKDIAQAEEDARKGRWTAVNRRIVGPAGKPEEGLLHRVGLEAADVESSLGLATGTMPRKLEAFLASFPCRGYVDLKIPLKALTWCKLTLASFPEDVACLIAKGDAHLLKEELDLAKDAFTLAKDAGPGDLKDRVDERLRRTERLIRAASKKDYYKVLNVDREASPREIKKAFRKQAQMWHPDKYRGDLSAEDVQKKMASINEAYDVLSDEEKRRQFDAGHDPNDPTGGHGDGHHGHGGFPFHAGGGEGNPFQFFFQGQGGQQGGFSF